MKLTLNKFHVQDIQFAEASSFCSGVLYINKAELAEYLMEDTNIRSVDFDIARPGESVRIVPIKDVVQPRFKQSGSGQVFPGFVGDVETVGMGKRMCWKIARLPPQEKLWHSRKVSLICPGRERNLTVFQR